MQQLKQKRTKSHVVFEFWKKYVFSNTGRSQKFLKRGAPHPLKWEHRHVWPSRNMLLPTCYRGRFGRFRSDGKHGDHPE